MNGLKRFLSPEDEPVRRYIYTLLVTVVAMLIPLGVVTDQVGTALLGVAAAALVLPVTAEAIRAKVTPAVTPVDEERLS